MGVAGREGFGGSEGLGRGMGRQRKAGERGELEYSITAPTKVTAPHDYG